MKVGDSGMPEEEYWNSLFDVPHIVDWVAIPPNAVVVEVGCGYGTFTVAVAQKAAHVYAFDIEPEMIRRTQAVLRDAGRTNVSLHLRDVLDSGMNLPASSVDCVLLINILHFNERRVLLEQAARVLRKGGVVAVVHWRRDINTPRGPALELRPERSTILSAVQGLPLVFDGAEAILPPYHWGMKLTKVD